MKEKSKMATLIDKRHLGSIFKMDKSQVAATPNLKKLKKWAIASQEAKSIDLKVEVLVCYRLTQWVGFNEDYPVETSQVKVFTIEQILKLEFEQVLEKV